MRSEITLASVTLMSFDEQFFDLNTIFLHLVNTGNPKIKLKSSSSCFISLDQCLRSTVRSLCLLASLPYEITLERHVVFIEHIYIPRSC